MSDEPNPVLPLSYLDRSSDPWMYFIRAMAVVAMLEGVIRALPLLLIFGVGTVQKLSPSILGPKMPSFASTGDMAVYLANIAAAALLALGGRQVVTAARGRRMIVWGAAASIVCLCTTMVFSQLQWFSMRKQLGENFLKFQVMQGVFTLLHGCLLPALIWYFFRRPMVRQLLDENSRQN